MIVRKNSNLTLFCLTFTLVISNLLMSVLIFVGISEMTVSQPVLIMKLVLMSATKTSSNALAPVLVRLSVQLVVTNVHRRFANVEIQKQVLIISNARKGSFLV